jgi:hypothetical protein
MNTKPNRRGFLHFLATLALAGKGRGQEPEPGSPMTEVDLEILKKLPDDLEKDAAAASLKELQKYLSRFGFLNLSAAKSGSLDPATIAAIKEYGTSHGLEGKGLVDAALRAQLLKPRCGMPDNPKTLYKKIGPWEKRELTYQFENGPRRGPSKKEAHRAVAQAFATWANEDRLTFSETKTNPDILIKWVPARHDDGVLNNIVIAHADYPPDYGWISKKGPRPVHFNDDLDWRTDGGKFDIQTVALHEIGHVLGLDHTQDHKPQAVMYSDYNGKQHQLDDDDKAGLRALYP